MKRITLIIAAIFAGAMLFSCQNGVEEEASAPILQELTISVEATKSFDTKALALSSDGKSLSATWEDGELVAVCWINPNNGDLSEVIGILAPTSFGTATTVLRGGVNLTGYSLDSKLFLQYPYKTIPDPSSGKEWLDCRYSGQDGELNTVSKEYAYATCGVDITNVDATTGGISTSKAEFYNRQAIVKFSLKAAGSPLDAIKLRVHAPSLAERFWHDDYYVNWGSLDVISPTAPRNEFTVALRNQESDPEPYTLYAVGMDNVYTATTQPLAFADGTYNCGTGDLVAMSYASYDAESAWSITGDLSAYGVSWDNDLKMWTDGHGRHVAAGVTLNARDEFKFRKDRKWDVDFGGAMDFATDAFTVRYSGPNITVFGDGLYDIYLDENTFTAVVVPASNAGKTSTLVDEPYVPDPNATYTVAGASEMDSVSIDKVFTSQWNEYEANEMYDSDGDGVYEWSVMVDELGAPMDIEFKIVKNHNWKECWPAGDSSTNYRFTIYGGGIFFVTFNPATGAIDAWMEYAYPYTVVGGSDVFGSGWDPCNSSNNMMDQGNGTWLLVKQNIPAGQRVEFQVVKNHNWNDGVWPSSPYVHTVAGPGNVDLHITFSPANGTIVLEEVKATPITIDGSFDDWAAVDQSKLSIATCASDPVDYGDALKVLKVGADTRYVYVYIKFDPQKITWNASEYVPIHLYLNSDGNAETGGGLYFFLDACLDYILEGFMTDGVNMVSYDADAYRWIGQNGEFGWNWSSNPVVSYGLGLTIGAGAGDEYEIRVDKSMFPKGFANTFSIGVDIQQEWATCGFLPNATTSGAEIGYTQTLQVQSLL